MKRTAFAWPLIVLASSIAGACGAFGGSDEGGGGGGPSNGTDAGDASPGSADSGPSADTGPRADAGDLVLEDFESYTAGDSCAPWSCGGCTGTIVADSFAHSGKKSCQVCPASTDESLTGSAPVPWTGNFDYTAEGYVFASLDGGTFTSDGGVSAFIYTKFTSNGVSLGQLPENGATLLPDKWVPLQTVGPFDSTDAGAVSAHPSYFVQPATIDGCYYLDDLRVYARAAH